MKTKIQVSETSDCKTAVMGFQQPSGALVFLVILSCASRAMAWDYYTGFTQEEYEVFDLVEEVDANFYEFLQIPTDSNSSEVRKAYRKLSLVIHPDKCEADQQAECELKFRLLAGIYEVLKDKERRLIYDRVLYEGLPNKVIRQMRKVGLAEGLAILLAIVTVCQYFINKAAYWEKKFTIKENISERVKKTMKKQKRNATADEEVAEILAAELEILGPRPSAWDTLPFQLLRAAKYVCCAAPTMPAAVYAVYKDARDRREAAARALEAEEEERKRAEEEKRERKEQKKQRKQVGRRYREKADNDEGSRASSDSERRATVEESTSGQPRNALQLWTDDELSRLAKLMKRFPGGTPERWEKIADVMERLPSEVTKMAKKVKDFSYLVPVSTSAQGVTGLEAKRLIADDRMEHVEDADEDEEEDDDDEEETDEEDEDENYGAYSVASKEEYTPVAVKTKQKTKGGKLCLDDAAAEPSLSSASDALPSSAPPQQRPPPPPPQQRPPPPAGFEAASPQQPARADVPPPQPRGQQPPIAVPQRQP